MRNPRAVLTLMAVLALTAGAANAIATPSTAEAACAHWRLPSPRSVQYDLDRRDRLPYYAITQSNRWRAYVRFSDHRAIAVSPLYRGVSLQYSGELSLTSFNPDLVKFIISWDNGSGGVYTGTIDDNGFISGTTVDRFRPTSRASWHMLQHAVCG